MNKKIDCEKCEGYGDLCCQNPDGSCDMYEPKIKMNREEVLKKIIDIVSDKLTIEKEGIFEKSNLEADLGADSLDGVDIIMTVEDEFDFDISNLDADEMITVGDIVDYIFKRLNDEPN